MKRINPKKESSSGKLAADEVCEPFSTNIYAAAVQNDIEKGELVGTLTAYSDGDYLYVTYDVADRGCPLDENNERLHLNSVSRFSPRL